MHVFHVIPCVVIIASGCCHTPAVARPKRQGAKRPRSKAGARGGRKPDDLEAAVMNVTPCISFDVPLLACVCRRV